MCYINENSEKLFDKTFFPFSYEQLYSFDTQHISDFLVEIA